VLQIIEAVRRVPESRVELQALLAPQIAQVAAFLDEEKVALLPAGVVAPAAERLRRAG
jgi:hypothetical protein